MNYGETDPLRRGVPVYLRDAATPTSPVTGAVPTGSQLQVSKDGAAWVNGGGSWTEVGSGFYREQVTEAETQCNSFLLVKILVPGAKAFVYVVDIGERFAGESNASALRIPIYLESSSGSPVVGITPTVRISLNGAPLVAGLGTVHEIGGTGNGQGGYYYEATPAEQAAAGTNTIEVTGTGAVTYRLWWDVVSIPVPPVSDTGYFGGYFGMGVDGSTVVAPPPAPVPSPYVPESPLYVDHAAGAIARLPEQFKAKAT